MRSPTKIFYKSQKLQTYPEIRDENLSVHYETFNSN